MKSGKRHFMDGMKSGKRHFMDGMKSGKRHFMDGMKLPNQDKIGTFRENPHHHHHHHHHVVLVAWISLTLSRHSSLSFIALGRSSGQHPVSSHSCWMYVRAGRPAFARPYVGVHREKETYKYLGILEGDTIKQVEMKEKIKKEYSGRNTKLLDTKLCSRNLIKAINTIAVPLVR